MFCCRGRAANNMDMSGLSVGRGNVDGPSCGESVKEVPLRQCPSEERVRPVAHAVQSQAEIWQDKHEESQGEQLGRSGALSSKNQPNWQAWQVLFDQDKPKPFSQDVQLVLVTEQAAQFGSHRSQVATG